MERLSRVVITHADADHCGAGGHYAVPALMHTGTRDIIRVSNRAYGSRSQSSILEEVYTSLINLFSQFCPPRDVALLLPPGESRRGRFSILATFDVGNHPVEVLEGMGGHLHGQIYLYSRDIGVFFSADTLINFDHLTPERARYNTLAVNLVTSVNVDSERAKEERKAILEIVRETSGQFYGQREKCLVCGGHGPVSILEGRSLLPFGKVVHIPPVGGGCPR